MEARETSEKLGALSGHLRIPLRGPLRRSETAPDGSESFSEARRIESLKTLVLIGLSHMDNSDKNAFC
eukprot:12444431-Alexandrium_andersonii.AAC.1